MDPVQAHLLLNHIPILGSLFGIILLLIGMLRKNPILEYAGVVSLVLVALFAGAAFMTGEEAEHSVEKIAGISKHFLEEHEELSEKALWASIIVGFLALVSLALVKIESTKARTMKTITLLLAIGSFALMVIVGNHGGKIRHSELIDGAKDAVHSSEGHDNHMEHDDDDD